jgi:ornithine cyclodeaminase/alanine dehydrogenase-like protein (mu-crystallin family)
VLILHASDVRRALPMPDAIAAMKRAFAALSAGHVSMPPRAHLRIARHAGISLFMPAYVDDDDPAGQALTIKAVSLYDRNQARGLARIQAAVLVLEPDTGRPVALLEGAALTAIRTAAASGAATDLLARPDSRRLAILGAGVQARSHIEAMCAVRNIERIVVFDPTPSKVAALIDEMSGRVHVQLTAADTPGEAIRDADIVCTTTTSRTPVFHDADIQPGTHVNAVGSYQPEVREIPPETVVRAKVIVDSRQAAWEEAGDLIQPLHAGLIDADHIHAELGEVVAGTRTGRTTQDAITLFKSVGIAVQDAFAAQMALIKARREHIGQVVDW